MQAQAHALGGSNGPRTYSDIDQLALALARWLDAAQTLADGAERRLAALEEARLILAERGRA